MKSKKDSKNKKIKKKLNSPFKVLLLKKTREHIKGTLVCLSQIEDLFLLKIY